MSVKDNMINRNIKDGISIFVFVNVINILLAASLLMNVIFDKNIILSFIISITYILVWLSFSYILGYKKSIGGLIALIIISLIPFLSLVYGDIKLFSVHLAPILLLLNMDNILVDLLVVFFPITLFTIILWLLGKSKSLR